MSGLLSTLAPNRPIEGSHSGESLFFSFLPSDLWVSGSYNRDVTKSRGCESERIGYRRATKATEKVREPPPLGLASVCLLTQGNGAPTFFPTTSFYVLSRLTTWKRQQTYLKMTVIFREREMANIRPKKYEVNISPWRAKEIIRVIWQPQSPGTWPACWLSHCYLYESGRLSCRHGGNQVGSTGTQTWPRVKETGNPCYLPLNSRFQIIHLEFIISYSSPNTHTGACAHARDFILSFPKASHWAK